MKCPSCSSEIPGESRFCLKCGKDLVATPPPPQDDGSEMFALMAMGIAFMMFFFSLAPFFLGIWIAGIAMLGVGVVLMIAGYRMIRASKKDQVAMMQRHNVRVRCRYCGTLNGEHEEKCDSCGANL
ncbi:TPA: hypothetical protein HA259_06475 [Thermoplasmata archaeon]|nr:hypothetical protein [Thermoplasmata archaeon]